MVIFWSSTKRKYLVFFLGCVVLCYVFICYSTCDANVNYNTLIYAFGYWKIWTFFWGGIEECEKRWLIFKFYSKRTDWLIVTFVVFQCKYFGKWFSFDVFFYALETYIYIQKRIFRKTENSDKTLEVSYDREVCVCVCMMRLIFQVSWYWPNKKRQQK